MRRRGIISLFALVAAGSASAQLSVYESEPNNTPAEANPIHGEVLVSGSMQKGDQDGYMWTVSDNDARKRWTFELQGTPGRLTIAEVVRVEFADNGSDVAGVQRVMKMGTRDGLAPVIQRDLIFEPGEYLIGIAYAGGGSQEGGGVFRPPAGNLSFGESGSPETGDGSALAQVAEPGGYRFSIREGSRLTVSKNPGPRESREAAQAIRVGSEFATFETLETSWYAFSFNEKDATQRWDIPVQAPVGRKLKAALFDANGEKLSSASSDDMGRLSFADLAPEAATYYVELSAKSPGFIHAVASTAVGQRVAGEEAEPNDEWRFANHVDLSQPLTGRISKTGEWDFFRFALDEATTDQVLNLRLDTEPTGQALEFCLLGDDKARVQCRREKSPVELPDLVLNPGAWGLSVNRAKEGMEYRISLSGQGAISEGMEAEPNDAIEFASGVPANNRIKGRLSTGEDDYFRFLVVDEPQLWRFQVIGEDITEIAYYDGAGKQAARIRPDPGQRRMRLENLYLLPGQHYLRVSGRDGGSYTVLARPLGPPDPNGEREPNDDDSRMQRLDIGQTRNGRLSDPDDNDFYRFFLAHWDHVRLTVQPPADGVIYPQLYWYGGGFADAKPGGPGEAVTLSGLFPPGDYHVALRPRQDSDAEYRLSLERLPRFSCPADCEPNGVSSLYLAAPTPPDLVLEGRSGEWSDNDPYELPVFDQPTELLVRSEQPVRSLKFGINRYASENLKHDPELGGYALTIPAGGPYRLIVDSRGEPYRLALEFADGPRGPVAIQPLPVELALELEQDRVSAFRTHGQRLSGALLLNNTGDQALELDLEAVTSDYRWEVSLEQPRASVPARGRTSVPLQVRVPPDAWADRPTRISVRAVGGNRAQVEDWQDIAVDRDLPPVGSHLSWAIPAALRGGFNAAWAPWGAELTGEAREANKQHLLFDGLVFAGARMACCGKAYGWGDGPRPELTLDLPGDVPLPVAGIALNHFGSPGVIKNLRRGTLLLSEDGVNYQEALKFETLPIKTEQYFALDSPVMARFARLRLEETFDLMSGSGGVTMGEWKVILQPGHDLSGGAGFNLADPELGGHLVSDWPPRAYSPKGVISQKEEQHSIRLKEGQDQDYIIGFHHNRAAQIRRIEWQYSEEANEAQKFERLNLSVSMDSPIGPWSPVAELTIERDGPTTAIDFDAPIWARFVKFSAAPGEMTTQNPVSPARIQIFERPGGDEYRSVLTEWGYSNPHAYYELQAGLAPEPQLRPASNDARARAAALAIGARAGGEVALSRQEHWYRLQVPAGDNTLSLTLAGDPTVRTRIEIADAGGAAIALRKLERESNTREHRFEAVVEPGSEVFLRIFEPPRNVVFSWDTSASTGAYLPVIFNSLAAFATQVILGQEAVNLVPFGRSTLLRDWYGESYVLQTILNDYPRRESSSSAELTLKRSAQALAPLAGTKSIVVITDGITVHDGSMWEEMREVQPRIFGVHVGGSEGWNQDVFEDWAGVNGGHYTQLFYDGEMEVAFDRAATMMRRPAGYTLLVESEFREAPGPGLLQVMAGDGAGGGTTPAGGAAVELILDASGSMLQRMEGKRRINIAREVLIEAVRSHIPAGTPVALRVFGHKEPDACRSDLEIPLAPLDPARAAQVIEGIQAMNLARTPIADSLAAVAGDLKGSQGRAAIVLVTDGEETCEGDPAAVIEALQDKGMDISLNIVGFAIDDADLEAQFRQWAELGDGRYFAARDQAGLSEALTEALRLPYAVYDAAGELVARGQVGGELLELDQGVYRVVVDSAPPRTFDRVEVPGEKTTTLRLD